MESARLPLWTSLALTSPLQSFVLEHHFLEYPVVLTETEIRDFDLSLRSLSFLFFLCEGILRQTLDGATRRPCLSVLSDTCKAVKDEPKASTSASFALKFLSPSQAFPPFVGFEFRYELSSPQAKLLLFCLVYTQFH